MFVSLFASTLLCAAAVVPRLVPRRAALKKYYVPLVAGAAGLPLSAFAADEEDKKDAEWSLSRFYEEVGRKAVGRVYIAADSLKLVALDNISPSPGAHVVALLPNEVSNTIRVLRDHSVVFEVQSANPPYRALDAAADLLFTGTIFGGAAYIFSKLGRAPEEDPRDLKGKDGKGGNFDSGETKGRGPGDIMNLLKSRAKVQYEPVTGIDFSVIAGCDESKRELQEVVEFLKHPQKFNKLGAVCPRGVILEGPPGTGKTLLARAVAGEAGVPFIAASGSEFIEMFVGVGASRIRSMFADAMRSAPCIIFIDEIDAIGRKRAASGGFMGANDEREQTLNQILSELDGFHGNTGVIVIAATNRADVLDPALLRPGRFDRRIPIPLPDRIGREAILEVHARGKALGPDVDLAAISARTTGFSGAMLENLLNEAAIYAVRGNKDSISADHVEAALDRLTLGLQRVSSAANVKRREVVAWHEAGHAAMALLACGP